MKDEVYVSIDVETDGPVPGLNSMLSLGAALFDFDGELVDSFGENLDELDNAHPNYNTMAWWETQPKEIWVACRENAIPPGTAIERFDNWLEQTPRPSGNINLVPICWPAAFDHMWPNYYGWRFLNKYVLDYAALDVRSYLQGKVSSTHYFGISEAKVWEMFGKPDLSKYGELRDHVARDDAIKQGALYFHIRDNS